MRVTAHQRKEKGTEPTNQRGHRQTERQTGRLADEVDVIETPLLKEGEREREAGTCVCVFCVGFKQLVKYHAGTVHCPSLSCRSV